MATYENNDYASKGVGTWLYVASVVALQRASRDWEAHVNRGLSFL